MSNVESTPEQQVELTAQETAQPEVTSAPEASAPVEAAPVAAAEETVAGTPVIAQEQAEPAAEATPEEPKEDTRALRQQHYEKVYNMLKTKKEANETITVEVKARIRGGLRVIYDEMPLFLPASHFGLKKNPGEEELQDAIGKSFEVYIHEMQETEDGRRTVIVSRRNILNKEIWSKISVGDVIEGRVSSVATFGVFVDIGGLEGLIHVSRLSQFRLDPMTAFKRGDEIKATIVDIDKEKGKIALSRKELEESPWKGATELFPVDSIQKGIVRRLTDFGAYVELKPGVDGLLRATELQWATRVKRPADVLTAGQEIDVYIMAISEENHTVSLSVRRTKPNPWEELATRYTAGTEFKGTITQIIQQGAIVRLNEEIDGFVPRSKMRNHLQGKHINLNVGDKLEVVVSDIVPAEESLILVAKGDENYQGEEHDFSGDREERRGGDRRDDRRGGDRRDDRRGGERRGGDRRDREDRTPIDPSRAGSNHGSFTIGDLLSDTAQKSLYNNIDE